MSQDVFRAIEQRWSCRAFQPAPVDDEVVEKLLKAMIKAPSAGNRQPWHFYVVTNGSVKRGLAEAAYGQEFVAQAPVVIVVCAVPSESAGTYGERGSTLYCIQDTAAAIQNLLVAAESLGLGTCWVGAFDESLASSVLGLPDERRPVGMVPVGKPAAPRTQSRRRPERQVVTWVR
ncbi:MAG: nitroreductase family protein [Candidatus Eiseniibacteriota bacterium]|nr:MAG: nitroreductase family protein [Candidatus Eisenbacteria bacterium]